MATGLLLATTAQSAPMRRQPMDFCTGNHPLLHAPSGAGSGGLRVPCVGDGAPFGAHSTMSDSIWMLLHQHPPGNPTADGHLYSALSHELVFSFRPIVHPRSYHVTCSTNTRPSCQRCRSRADRAVCRAQKQQGLLDWAGLGWAGLDWTGLDWTGMDQNRVEWTGPDWLDWVRMDSSRLGRQRPLQIVGDVRACPSCVQATVLRLLLPVPSALYLTSFASLPLASTTRPCG